MGRKIVNLDDKETTVCITVGGREHEITRVVLALKEMYGRYVTAAAEYCKTVNEFDDYQDQLAYAEDYALQKAEALDEMMDKLLADNGYKYEKKWWAENVAGYETMEQFIVQALMKDAPDDKKKANPGVTI